LRNQSTSQGRIITDNNSFLAIIQSFGVLELMLVMCVGASDANYRFATFSNFGKGLGIIAPGVEILSTWATSDVATRKANGTSMATPHVAGVMATIVGYENLNTDASKVRIK
jgi:subtilisin family serine protease